MTFDSPLWLLLLALLPLVVYEYFRRPAGGSVRFSSIDTLKRLRISRSVRARHILIVLRVAALALLIVGLARPRSGREKTEIRTEGIDIVLVIDVSGSMRAEDFGKGYNRLQAVKDVVRDFIKGRENDRIGMVVFSRFAYTQCPLTLDYGVLLQFLEKVKIGMIEDGTNIGSAIGVATDRLKQTKAKSRIMVLLTDGRHNVGKIDPITAADIAKTFDIKIYTIGAGTREPWAFIPTTGLFGEKTYTRIPVQIDEETLRKIARATGGKYFRATDADSLKKIYAQIDKLEKTESKVKMYTEYNELFYWFVLPALALVLLEIVLANTRFRKIP